MQCEAVHDPVFDPLKLQGLNDRIPQNPTGILSPPSSLPCEPNTPFPIPNFFPTSDMSDQSGPSHLQVLFEAALQDYEKQTGIALSKHPLAEQLQNCGSVESVTAVLRDQTQAFSQFLENDKVLKPLKKVVSILYKLSAPASFGQDIGLVCSSLTRCSLFAVPHPRPIAFLACESNTYGPRRSTLCMYLSLLPKRASL